MKTLLAFLLIISFVLPAQAQQSINDIEEQPKTNQETLTQEEENEAREMAQKFIERFEENKDVLSLADDFYVNDFVSRMRKRSESFYFVHLSPELWEAISDADAKKLYFRSLQFVYYSGMVYQSKEIICKRNQEPDEEENNCDIKMEEVFPPEIISLIKTDETMRKILGDLPSEENVETNQESESNDELKTNEELQSLLKFFDDVIPLMKNHLESLDAPHKWEQLLEEYKKVQNESEDEDEDIFNPRVTVLTSEFFGAPEGTRLICINAMFLHMDLVRVDDKLKILNVYLEND